MSVIIFESGIEFTVYADLATADLYAFGSYYATKFRAATDIDRMRALVQATREFEAQCWSGTKTSAGQALQFPRTGLTRADGTAVDPDSIPDEVINAAVERAISIIDGVAKANEKVADANIRKLGAGSAQIEYFRPITDPSQFPRPVLDLIARWLCGRGNPNTVAFGTDGESNFDDDFGFSDGF